QLLRLNRRSLTHVMILGGSREDRLQLARAFHRESPNRLGPFVRLDCRHDEARITAHLEELLWARGPREGSPSHSSARGTPFLDSIASLPRPGQRLLLELASHAADADAEPQLVRVILGNRDDLASEVASGRFLDALLDCLDKLRVHLEPGTA